MLGYRNMLFCWMLFQAREEGALGAEAGGTSMLYGCVFDYALVTAQA
jgi:hypothetical protein